MEPKPISFTYHATSFEVPQPSQLADWLLATAVAYGQPIKELTYIFGSDDYIHQINLEHLGHDTLTDVITFDLSDDAAIVGEVYVSVDRVRENADQFKVAFQQELCRVMVHGLLHLLGFADKDTLAQERMRKAENLALTTIRNIWDKTLPRA